MIGVQIGLSFETSTTIGGGGREKRHKIKAVKNVFSTAFQEYSVA